MTNVTLPFLKNSKIVNILALLVLLQSGGFIFAESNKIETRLSISDCLRIAYENSPDLNTEKWKVEEMNSRVDQQIGYILPQFDATLSSNHYGQELPSKKALFGNSLEDFYADISVKQILFSGGKYIAGISSAKAVLEGEKQKLKTAERLLEYNVKKNYFEQIRSQYAVNTQNELIEKLRQQVKIAEVLYNSGKLPYVDVLKIKTQEASAEDSLKNYQETEQLRSLLLGQSAGVNESIHALSDLDEPIKDVAISGNCVRSRFSENSELLYAASISDRSVYDVDIARADILPTLYVKGNYNFEDKTFFPGNPNWVIGLGLTIPLFHGGTIINQVKQAEDRQKQATEFLKATALNLTVKFESAIFTLRDRMNRLRGMKRTVDLSREALIASEIKYDFGKISAMELIDSQTVWNNSLLGYRNMIVDYYIALADIEFLCPDIVQEEQK